MAEISKDLSKSPLEEYLSTRNILIVDPSSSVRAAMARMLIGIGAKSANITLVAEYDVALEILNKDCPDIVITEYSLPRGNGLELASEFNRLRKNESTLFVIITANSSQSVVAQAAEEDVDVYILKPYTMNYFLENITRAAQLKIRPTEYVKKINQGKRKTIERSIDEAYECFDLAATLTKTPSLAYYYRSRMEILMKLNEPAEHSLEQGLSYNPVHYKCLTGLFDLLMEMGRVDDAYGIVKRLSAFPLNPKRLSKVIELAVKTAHYGDIETYYESFKELEVRDEDTIKHICAALIVSGKKLFQRGDMYKAATLLKYASVSAAGRENILLEIVYTLAMNNFLPDAREVLKRFSNESQKEFRYQAACFLVSYYESGNSWSYALSLRKEIEDGASDPALFYWMIATTQISNKIDLADDYLLRAKKKWPEMSAYFDTARTAIPVRKDKTPTP